MSNRRIVLATSNPAKREQLRWLLEGLPLRPIDGAGIEVPEDSADLAANAVAKALAYSAGGLAIASDGGLEVPALGPVWRPWETRRQGPARLRELTSRVADRRVRWSEAVAVVDRGQFLASWTESGTEGILAPEPWPPPTNFWVWDIFIFSELGETWAQLTPNQRAAVDRTWLALKAHVQAFFRAHA